MTIKRAKKSNEKLPTREEAEKAFAAWLERKNLSRYESGSGRPFAKGRTYFFGNGAAKYRTKKQREAQGKGTAKAAEKAEGSREQVPPVS
jgi:hypothetical protein